MAMVVNTVWIGNELGTVHAACLRSFVRHGHDVVLHAYGRPHDTPEGVRLFDASKLMKEDEIVLHKKTNSLTLASDRYRYRILREGMGLYVDCDIYCVRPFIESDYAFGWHSDDTINNAVLNAPQGSAFLQQVLSASEDLYFIPPWFKKHKAAYARLRKALGIPMHISRHKWGTIGPSLITHCARQCNLLDKVSAIDVFYPLHWDQLDLLYERGLSVADLTTSRTLGVHLYNSALKNRPVIKDTPLYEIISS
ncbi:hypothetical protein [Pseudochrobactrum sp. HB0163]|uniref:hypothetical protein n=1 Tax=Pseudochrobactrum sp. HB0163 TaxID=3450708 RepID=UPI003F6E2E92